MKQSKKKQLFKPLISIVLLLIGAIAINAYMFKVSDEPIHSNILEVYTTKDIYFIDVKGYTITSQSGKHTSVHSTFESLQIEISKITAIDSNNSIIYGE